MSDRGRLSGFNWHFEFHTVDKKKEKAADCVFLDADRICHNKKSLCHLEKCFVASTCPHRVKEKEKNISTPIPTPSKPSNKISKIPCSLPKKCAVYHKGLGGGMVVGYDEERMHIIVEFFEKGSTKQYKFLYPDAILEEKLIVSKEMMRCVKYDLKKAIY